MKDIAVKMSKRKSTNSVLSFDVLNDINDWLAEEMVKTMKLMVILMDCAVDKKKLILTQERSASRKKSNLKNLKIM